jgi:hypothetical protein
MLGVPDERESPRRREMVRPAGEAGVFGGVGLPRGLTGSASIATSALRWNAFPRAASTSPSEASSGGRSIVPST